jgi:hypothetical protein
LFLLDEEHNMDYLFIKIKREQEKTEQGRKKQEQVFPRTVVVREARGGRRGGSVATATNSD